MLSVSAMKQKRKPIACPDTFTTTDGKLKSHTPQLPSFQSEIDLHSSSHTRQQRQTETVQCNI